MIHNQNQYDPDLNFKSYIDHGIFTIDEINQLPATVKPQFSALLLNVRSINAHLKELCGLLHSIPFVFDTIGCTESWLTNGSDLNCIQIPGYNIITDNCTYSSGEGVMLFLKKEYNYSVRYDLKIDSIENLWIETDDLINSVIYIIHPHLLYVKKESF